MLNQTETEFLAAGDGLLPHRREEMTPRQLELWHECERLFRSVSVRNSIKGVANRFHLTHVVVEDRLYFYEHHQAVYARHWSRGETMGNLKLLLKMGMRVLKVQVADVEEAHRDIEGLRKQGERRRKDGEKVGPEGEGERPVRGKDAALVRGAAVRAAGTIHAVADLLIKIDSVAAEQRAEREEALKRRGARAEGAGPQAAVGQKDQEDALKLLRGVA